MGANVPLPSSRRPYPSPWYGNFGTVVDWLESSTWKAESTGLSPHPPTPTPRRLLCMDCARQVLHASSCVCVDTFNSERRAAWKCISLHCLILLTKEFVKTKSVQLLSRGCSTMVCCLLTESRLYSLCPQYVGQCNLLSILFLCVFMSVSMPLPVLPLPRCEQNRPACAKLAICQTHDVSHRKLRRSKIQLLMTPLICRLIPWRETLTVEGCSGRGAGNR